MKKEYKTPQITVTKFESVEVISLSVQTNAVSVSNVKARVNINQLQ